MEKKIKRLLINIGVIVSIIMLSVYAIKIRETDAKAKGSDCNEVIEQNESEEFTLEKTDSETGKYSDDEDEETVEETEAETIIELENEIETEPFLYDVWDVEAVTKYAKTSVNVRSLPTKESERLGTLKQGQDALVTGETNKGWFRVEYKGKTGYVSGNYLSKDRPVIETAAPATPVTRYEIPSCFRIDEGISQKVINQAIKDWNSFPQKWRDTITNIGTTIELKNMEFLDSIVPGYKQVIGATFWENPPRICLSNTVNHVHNGIYHEMGHLIDYANGWASSSDEFVNIYNAEKDSFIDMGRGINDGHSTSSSNEFFAAVSRQAILYRENIEKCAPQAYAFVCRYIY